jgi:hypothetical protein
MKFLGIYQSDPAAPPPTPEQLAALGKYTADMILETKSREEAVELSRSASQDNLAGSVGLEAGRGAALARARARGQLRRPRLASVDSLGWGCPDIVA